MILLLGGKAELFGLTMAQILIGIPRAVKELLVKWLNFRLDLTPFLTNSY
jgi:hypothetical protein